MSEIDYWLKTGRYGEIPFKIDKEIYGVLEESMRILNDALKFERIYEAVIQNYVELEESLFSNSLLSILHPSSTSYEGTNDAFTSMNRHLLNLLAFARAYEDQVIQLYDKNYHIKSLFQYKRKFNHVYFLMVNLRNHFQHWGLPVDNAKLNLKKDAKKITCYSQFYIQKDDLYRDEKFMEVLHKHTDLKDMIESIADDSGRIEIVNLAREYLNIISSVHFMIRAIIEPKLEAARMEIKLAMDNYVLENSDCVSLHACRDNDDEIVPILLEWEKCRMEMEKRNQKLPDLTKICISSNEI